MSELSDIRVSDDHFHIGGRVVLRAAEGGWDVYDRQGYWDAWAETLSAARKWIAGQGS